MRFFKIIISIIISTLFSTICFAYNPLVDLQFPSSPNPVGSGSNALGMGGAFIAIADDATAASWNPAGLDQLGVPEFSFVYSNFYRRTENNWENNPEAIGTDCVNNYNFNYISYVYPFPKEILGKKMVVSINYQHLYDFKWSWNFMYNHPDPIFTEPVTYNFDQEGALYALGLAYSIKLLPHLSAGFTINYWGDFLYENKWEKKYYQKSKYKIPPTDIGILRDSTRYKTEEFTPDTAWNFNFGFRYKIIPSGGKHLFKIAGVLKTSFKTDIDHIISTKTSQIFPEGGGIDTYQEHTDPFKEKLHMPASFGLGLAYSYNQTNSKSISLSCDIYRTNWNHFEFEDSAGLRKSPINGKSSSESNIKAATWIRFGVEYLNRDFIIAGKMTTLSIRGGLFYDPAPAENSPDDYYGLSFGTGMSYKFFVFDIAYQYRFANNVGSSIIPDIGYSQDIDEHTVYSSFVLHFN